MRVSAEGTPVRGPAGGDEEVVAPLIAGLHRLGAVRFGDFRLKSGAYSPVYLDLRLLVSDPPLLARVAQAYARLLAGLEFDRIAAVPYAGLPIGTAVAMVTGRPMIYPRKEVKGYGTRRPIEGRYQAGETAVVLDDLITTGGSKLEAIRPLEEAGLVVRDVVVLVDRQGSGAADLAAAGYRLHRVLTLSQIVDQLARDGHITARQAASVAAYLGRSAGGAGE